MSSSEIQLRFVKELDKAVQEVFKGPKGPFSAKKFLETQNTLIPELAQMTDWQIKPGGQCSGMSQALVFSYLHITKSIEHFNMREILSRLIERYKSGADLYAACIQANQKFLDEVGKSSLQLKVLTKDITSDEKKFTNFLSSFGDGAYKIRVTGRTDVDSTTSTARPGHEMALFKRGSNIAFFDPNFGLEFFDAGVPVDLDMINGIIKNYIFHDRFSTYLFPKSTDKTYVVYAKKLAQFVMNDRIRPLQTYEAFAIYENTMRKFGLSEDPDFRYEFVTNLAIQPAMLRFANDSQEISATKYELPDRNA